MIKIKQRSYADQNNEHDILQLMRAFGILMVVIQHAVVLYFSTSFSDILITICVFVDVHVFMFVSGYLFQKKRDQYINTIDEVERITGYDFFPELPDDIEEVVESHADIDEW